MDEREKWRACSHRKPSIPPTKSQPLVTLPSAAQLEALQKAVDLVQHGLNRMQTAMDTWAEETEEV